MKGPLHSNEEKIKHHYFHRNDSYFINLYCEKLHNYMVLWRRKMVVINSFQKVIIKTEKKSRIVIKSAKYGYKHEVFSVNLFHSISNNSITTA